MATKTQKAEIKKIVLDLGDWEFLNDPEEDIYE